MKLDLINSMNDRNVVMSEENISKVLGILRKFNAVVDYMTSDMVAELYGVGERAIADIGTTKKDELTKYGYRVYKKIEILNMELPYLENIPNRGLRLYPIQAVLVIGMMLTESKIAEQLRREIVKEIFGTKEEETNLPYPLAFYNFGNALTLLPIEAKADVFDNLLQPKNDITPQVKMDTINSILYIERTKPFENDTSKVIDRINVNGLNTKAFYVFLMELGLGEYRPRYLNKRATFIPNDNFTKYVEGTGYAVRLSSDAGDKVKFRLEFADEINRLINTDEEFKKLINRVTIKYRNASYMQIGMNYEIDYSSPTVFYIDDETEEERMKRIEKEKEENNLPF